jgi:hypothetical protein
MWAWARKARNHVTVGISNLWRMIWTPKVVRDIEDSDPQDEAKNLSDPPPPVESLGLGQMSRRLDDVEARNRQIEERMRELARYYDRAENGGP